MKSYCVKQKKQTECVEPSGTATAKKWKKIFFGAHAPNVVLKKQNLRETKSAPSRRGHFEYSSINWSGSFC